MVQGYAFQASSRSGGKRSCDSQGEYFGERSSNYPTIIGDSPHHGGYSDDQRDSYSTAKFKLRWSKTLGREVGVFMLSVTSLNHFYYLCDFHDMRCKYERVLSMTIGITNNKH